MLYKTHDIINVFASQVKEVFKTAKVIEIQRSYNTNELGQNTPAAWHSIGTDLKILDYMKNINFELGEYRVQIDGVSAAYWKLYQLQHCCAIAVSCGANVDPAFRGKGFGRLCNHLRQAICKLLGYSLLLCTDVSTNVEQRRLLKSCGWRDVDQVYNRRTGNTVILSTINL